MLSLYREVLANSWDVEKHRPPEHILKVYPELHEHLLAYSAEDPQFAERMEKTRLFSRKRVLDCHFDASVRTDGPVHAGGGFVIRHTGGEVLHKSRFVIPPYLGLNRENGFEEREGLEPVSSHIAEYLAMNACLRALLSSVSDPSLVRVNLYTDSMNLKNQMDGFSRVRNPIIQELIQESRHLLSLFERVRLVRIPREENMLADRLAEEALHESINR